MSKNKKKSKPVKCWIVSFEADKTFDSFTEVIGVFSSRKKAKDAVDLTVGRCDQWNDHPGRSTAGIRTGKIECCNIEAFYIGHLDAIGWWLEKDEDERENENTKDLTKIIAGLKERAINLGYFNDDE